MHGGLPAPGAVSFGGEGVVGEDSPVSRPRGVALMGFNWRQWLPPLSSHGFQAETVGEQSHQGLPPPSRAPSLFWSDLDYATRPSSSRS